MEEIFGPEGLIARAHPEYEYRPGQIQMAEAVLRAFEERRHLIVEAGTGTGKTLAYLVPAIAAAVSRGGRVVVSTGTKNLQEQLMEKDIPFLQRVLPRKFTAAYMKGRSNYVCLQRVRRAETTPILEGLDDVDHFEEAHQVEDIAAEYFGAQVSNYQLEDMLRDLQMLPVTDAGLNRELTRASSRVARFAEQFWLGFTRERG